MRLSAAALFLLLLAVAAVAPPALAADEFTLYELLAPESHQFAITYDVTQDREGAELFFNPIRPGSVATKEKVLLRDNGQELRFDVVDGKEAKASGLLPATTADDAKFIRVHLPGSVPKGGQTRIRILKTYTDAASYTLKDDRLVFERPLGIKRNVVALPKGWALAGNDSPGIVSTDADGRIRVSFVNDRDDQYPVKIVARRQSAVAAPSPSSHRAEQDREIRYWLLEPDTHQFRISHDFTVTRTGQASVHSFVRKGSVVAPDAKMTDLDSGKPLVTHNVAGKDVNALGYYPDKVEPDSVAVQGDLEAPIAAGGSKRIRVEETYTDPAGYTMDGGELLWKRTLGRPLNWVTLPAGWVLTSVNVPAIISLDAEGRTRLRLANARTDELAVAIKARRGAAKR